MWDKKILHKIDSHLFSGDMYLEIRKSYFLLYFSAKKEENDSSKNNLRSNMDQIITTSIKYRW